jgi:DNA topoisomerase I
MLRCSIFEHRQGKCKEAAYFQGRDGFWSPKFGDLVVAPAIAAKL